MRSNNQIIKREAPKIRQRVIVISTYYQRHREEILAQKKIYLQEHREEILASKRAYYQEHKNDTIRCYRDEHADEIKARADVYREKNRNVTRAKRIWKNYRITVEEYDALILKGCYCGSTEDLCIDHDHNCCLGRDTCGKCIRGVLCGRHNRAEGGFLNINEVRGLLFYLEQYAAKNEEVGVTISDVKIKECK